MARRKKVYNRPETRDPRYDSPVVGKLISKVMRDGKRSLSERIVYAAIDKANEGTHVALSNEIKDAANNQGNAVRKRDDMHKMAQANRAFAHFRW